MSSYTIEWNGIPGMKEGLTRRKLSTKDETQKRESKLNGGDIIALGSPSLTCWLESPFPFFSLGHSLVGSYPSDVEVELAPLALVTRILEL